MDELDDIIECRFCGYTQLYKIKICSNCNKDLSYIIPEYLNDLSFLECIKLIDDAFFRLESFMNGKIDNYNYFGFNNYFSKLFYECKKEENFTVQNCNLISPYWNLANMLCFYIDKGDYKNENADENDNFYNDSNELCIISNDRINEFCDFETTEYVETKTSITDIIESRQTNQPQQSETPDLPYNSIDAKTIFENKFDKVNEAKIIEYFKKNLVDKKYLTEIELNKYLKQAFELRTAPKQKYNFKNIDSIENIVHVFYKYYKDVTTESTYGRQSDYFNLLKNYFDGFERIHINNFSKQYVSIRN